MNILLYPVPMRCATCSSQTYDRLASTFPNAFGLFRSALRVCLSLFRPAFGNDLREMSRLINLVVVT